MWFMVLYRIKSQQHIAFVKAASADVAFETGKDASKVAPRKDDSGKAMTAIAIADSAIKIKVLSCDEDQTAQLEAGIVPALKSEDPK